jgi:hypothetical protein
MGASGVQRNTRLYRIYAGMKARCYNKSCQCFSRYGGNGINICAEWLEDYGAFAGWATTHGYRNHLTIDRIDNARGYSPDNCQWISREENTARQTASEKQMIARRKNMKKGYVAAQKPVVCLETGEVFPSGRIAARAMGFSDGAVSAAMVRGGKCNGLTWMRVEDMEDK